MVDATRLVVDAALNVIVDTVLVNHAADDGLVVKVNVWRLPCKQCATSTSWSPR